MRSLAIVFVLFDAMAIFMGKKPTTKKQKQKRNVNLVKIKLDRLCAYQHGLGKTYTLEAISAHSATKCNKNDTKCKKH